MINGLILPVAEDMSVYLAGSPLFVTFVAHGQNLSHRDGHIKPTTQVEAVACTELSEPTKDLEPKDGLGTWNSRLIASILRSQAADQTHSNHLTTEG